MLAAWALWAMSIGVGAAELTVPAAPYERVLVYHLDAPELTPRQQGMLTAALLSEIRSIPGHGALSAGRARHQPILGDPAERVRCMESEECLRRALRLIGAQSLMIGTVSPTGDSDGGWLFTLEKMTARGVRTRASRKVPATAAGSDELLGAIEPLLAELLAPAGQPGVASAESDVPPVSSVPLVPVTSLDERTWLLPPWVFGVTAGLTLASVTAAVVVGAEMSSAESRFNQLTATRRVVSAQELRALGTRVYDLADAANGLLWVSGGLALSTLVVAFFTDFAPPVAPTVEVGVGLGPASAGPVGATVTGRW